MVADCLYILRSASKWIILINYVDDALYYCDSEVTQKWFEDSLSKRFDLKLLGEAKWYLGMQIRQFPDYITIDQSQYAKHISTRLEKAFKNVIKPQENSLTSNFIPTKNNCPVNQAQVNEVKQRFQNLHYRSAIRALLYMSY